MRKNQPALVLGAIGLFAGSFALAQNYQQMPIQSGFTADVIANGVGSSAVTTNNDVDGVSYAFVATDFQLTSTSTPITYGIPVNGLINSVVAATPGLSYQLASLSANNSLRLAAVNDAGTLVFTTPKAATKLYMLAVSGSGTSTVNVVVNFTDATTQTFSGISLADWYGGTNFAIQGIGRIKKPSTPSTASDDIPSPEGGTNPRLYQSELAILAANQTKLIQSVTVTKASGTGLPNIFAFSADAYSTCAPPTLQPVGTVTANSAAISWTAPTGSTVASYDIYYSTSSTVPASTATPNFPGETGTSKTIPGLNSNTTYYYWVRTNCSTGTSQSAWSFGGTFKTACSVFTTPYTENFDTTSTGSSTNTNAPSCWSYLESASFAGYGYVTASNPNSSPNSYYLNNSSATTGSQMLVSPPTTNLSNGTKRVRFYAKSGTAGTTLLVGTLANAADPATFTQIGSPITLTTTQTQYTVNIPTGTDAQVAFKHGLTATSRIIYIDDVTVQDIPSCFEPTAVTSSNVTVNSATVGWTAPATAPANGYEVYYSTSNVAPTGSTVLTPTNSTTSTTMSAPVGSLTSATTYYAWVRSVCSGTDKSVWSATSTVFTTACTTANLPYTIDFESVATPALPVCTVNVNAGTGNNWGTVSAPGYGFTTKALQYSWNGSNAANTWFFTQGLNLTAGTQYTIAYKYGNDTSVTYTEKLKVAFGTSATVAGMTSPIADYPAINDATAHTASINFTVPTTGVYYFGFNAYSDADQNHLFVDDISITSAQLATAETSAKKNDINAYPNPFTDILNISDIKNVKSISVMDTAGRLVKNIEKPSSTLHLGDLKQGVYLVVLNMNDGSKQTIKAIKK
ncbi:fibronectin type III domain-containing protein [Chryseobacterium gwangjuense]|uniref:fibronectin type III domain-containing protein n=1 Tax=Chryseobacterium gwangjuense TaxID=1069980 RepID=UPI001E4BD4D8|nr:fibronectin type III domain-containing protein [Chryseobacterium gwangjuense]MCE3076782.1 fibronectin type III domain-containing protein [Chryseobacterium gwangjuense]